MTKLTVNRGKTSLCCMCAKRGEAVRQKDQSLVLGKTDRLSDICED